jgi:hypothetical protein
MSPVFNPKQPYRIQNVDFQNYLAVKDTQMGSKVIMRPQEENDTQKVIKSVFHKLIWKLNLHSGHSSL